MTGWIAPSAEGVRIAVRVTANARSNRIGPVKTRADGHSALRIAVTAPPDKGRANRAVMALLADALERPKSAITITRGTTAREKTIAISGHTDSLRVRLQALAG